VTDHADVTLTDGVAAATAALRCGRNVLVRDRSVTIDDDTVALLRAAAEATGVATASPVPVAGTSTPRRYPLHPALPPAPSLPLPCPQLTMISADALASVDLPTEPVGTVTELLAHLGEQLVHHGWRHVATAGVALEWDAGDAGHHRPVAGWNAASIASLAGDANTGLEAHRSWATASLGTVTVAIDGVCLTDDAFTGTQSLVVEVARQMADVRPEATILLAVRRSQVASVSDRLSGSRVEVVERSSAVEADVVYRPYQMLSPRELGFVTTVGRRSLVGQLDMIGFSNPSYHPSEQLLFFARNLQRHLMRTADGVTFISAFGRESAFAECPDLDRDRLHVVSCGADPKPLAGRLGGARPIGPDDRLVVCLSSTFWHKNRTHAIATFGRLASHHGYSGHLVIAGPEPYFGRSTDAEQALLDSLPGNVAARVHRWGHIDDEEKWALLRQADLVLYPSIVEGFGLVPFEAAAVGTPCLAHAGTAPGELLAGTDAIVSSWRVEEWANRAGALIDGPRHARVVVDQVLAVAAEHTWRRCATRTWDAIDHALASPRRTVHAEDGGELSRVAPRAWPSPAAATVRFDAARGVPAVRRRLVRAWRQRGAR
jgi:glycosyltransferase involved in cell wall biosynthesis